MRNLICSQRLTWKQAAAVLVLSCTWVSFSAMADSQSNDPLQMEAPKTGVTYKGVNIQLGGFLASETIYRSNNTGSDIGTNYAKMPFQNSAGYGMSEFRGTERQSRFSLLAQGDADSDTRISGYYEIDFLAAAPTANANESNSFSPRTRNVYMTIDWENSGWHLLAGQNWSLITQNTKGITPRNEAIVPTIDAQYEVGFNWERQWQLRLVKDWSKTFWAAVSFENAQTVNVGGVAATGTGNTYQVAAGSQMANSLSINGFPDVIAKFAWESGFGHYEVFGLARNFESRYGASSSLSGQTNKQSEWTEGFGIAATVPVVPHMIDISVNALTGKGVGRYGTVQLPDVTYASDGSLEPLNATQYLAQFTWHAASTLDAYASYGVEQISANSGSNYGDGDGLGNSAAANNTACTTLGSNTCSPNLKSASQVNLGAWWSFYKGDYGVAKLGGQYSHTTLNSFADVNGLAVSTREDMVFTSLRYYPF